MKLSTQQRRHFETFGFLVLRGLLADEIGWITQEFEGVFAEHPGPAHDGTQRTCIVPFIDQSARLCTLLDHPQVTGLVASLLGERFNYIGGDGNFYTGNTRWHSDGWHEPESGLYLKVALYLDPVARDTGCLRVGPGSHRPGDFANQARGCVPRCEEMLGVAPAEVPGVALESQPGDLVAFNHNLLHASFGGSRRRRMFTLNFCSHASSEAEIEELKQFIGAHGRFWIDHLHSDLMRSTASPERMRHLEQVIQHEGHLPEAARRARETMAEPSRG
jgi:hypothetical protein